MQEDKTAFACSGGTTSTAVTPSFSSSTATIKIELAWLAMKYTVCWSRKNFETRSRILVYANKQDLPNSMSASDVAAKLGLHKLHHHCGRYSHAQQPAVRVFYEGLDGSFGKAWNERDQQRAVY